jgi:glutamyl-tRNA synthetase
MLKLQKSVWPNPLPDVQIWDYARISFINTLMSKRKLQWLVDAGHVDGWTDPRFPTVQGMARRGLQIEALRDFIVSQGASKNMTVQEWDKLWNINKRIIDPVAPRHTAIATGNQASLPAVPYVANYQGPVVPVTILDEFASEMVTVPKHVKNPAVGTKAQFRSRNILLEQCDATLLSVGDEVTMMAWGNMVVEEIDKSGADGAVMGVSMRLKLDGDVKKTKLKLTWLAADSDLVPLEVRFLGPLLNKKVPEEGDTMEQIVNTESDMRLQAVGDANMRTLQKGDVIQLERKGFFIVDQALTRGGGKMVLVDIPVK